MIRIKIPINLFVRHFLYQIGMLRKKFWRISSQFVISLPKSRAINTHDDIKKKSPTPPLSSSSNKRYKMYVVFSKLPNNLQILYTSFKKLLIFNKKFHPFSNFALLYYIPNSNHSWLSDK